MSGIRIREFCGRKFLSTSRDVRMMCEQISDIGGVQEPKREEENPVIGDEVPCKLDDARVVGVGNLQCYKGCMSKSPTRK